MIQLMETSPPISIRLAKTGTIYRPQVQYSDVKRKNLNYSISRAQYNAVTEIHMHTPEGGLSYTLPFTAFKGGTYMVPIPGMAETYGTLCVARKMDSCGAR